MSRVNAARASQGGIATSSSTHVGDYVASGAINGDRSGANWGNGGGWNDGTASSWPDWLEVAFSEPYILDEIIVFSVQDAFLSPITPTPTMTFSQYGLTNFLIQTWDGSTWQTVPGGSISGNTLVWRSVTFAQITTTKIRLWVTGALNTWTRLAEIEAWGTAVAPPPLPPPPDSSTSDVSVPRLAVAPEPFAGNPLLPLTAWYASQLYDPCVLVNPLNPAELLCYVSGMASPVSTGINSIGLFTAPASDPSNWAEVGQVLIANTTGWEAGGSGIRLGSVVYAADQFYLYYNRDPNGQIGVATSTDGRTFAKYTSNPILTPTGQGRNDGDYVSQPAVLVEDSGWTMVYSYRNGSAVMSGLRYATSANGLTWTKGGTGDIFGLGGLYCEFHQIVKLAPGHYVVIQEAGDGSHPFQIYVGYGNSPTNFTSTGVPLLSPSGVSGAWDRYHVATPCLCLINGSWKLFACASANHDQPYSTNTWKMGMWSVDSAVVTEALIATVRVALRYTGATILSDSSSRSALIDELSGAVN